MSNKRKLQNLAKDQLQAIIKQSSSRVEVLSFLGMPKDYRARVVLNERIKTEQHDITHFNKLRYKNYTVEDVKVAVRAAICISDVLRQIGLSCAGSNDKTIKNIIAKYNIDTSHFNVKQARRSNKPDWKYEDVFCEHSKFYRSTLRTKVFQFNVLEYKCNQCSNVGTWNGKTLNLIVDHINGIRDDNRVDNLRFLCPNCHAQTETFGNRKRTQ